MYSNKLNEIVKLACAYYNYELLSIERIERNHNSSMKSFSFSVVTIVKTENGSTTGFGIGIVCDYRNIANKYVVVAYEGAWSIQISIDDIFEDIKFLINSSSSEEIMKNYYLLELYKNTCISKDKQISQLYETITSLRTELNSGVIKEKYDEDDLPFG